MTFPTRLSFHPERPWLQMVWDSSSLSSYKRCPRRYFYSIVCGFVPIGESVDLKFGGMLHLGLETYYREKPERGHAEAQILGLISILKEAWVPLFPDGIAQDPMAVSGHYWRSHSNNKNLWNCLRSFIWYTEQFLSDYATHTAVIDDRPLLEYPFQFDLDLSVDGQGLTYCGHFDRVIDAPEGRWIVDYKSTKSTVGMDYFAKYQPSSQLPGYNVAGKIIFQEPVLGVRIDAVQVGVDFSRCARGHIRFSDEKADEWLNNTSQWVFEATLAAQQPHEEAETLVEFAQANARNWRMNEESCFICPFREVCASSPTIRGHLLEKAYVQGLFWDPLSRQRNET